MSKREIRAKRLVAAVLLAISVQMWSAPPLWAAEASVQTETSAAGEAKETKDAKDAKAADSETGGEADAGEEETVVVPVIGYSTRSDAGSDYGVMPLADAADPNPNFGGEWTKNASGVYESNGKGELTGVTKINGIFFQYIEDNPSLAIGDYMSGDYTYSLAIGGGAGVTADSATAVGFSTSAEGANSTAIGNSSVVYEKRGTAIGASAYVQRGHTGSVAIGYDSATTAANQVAFGTGKVTTDDGPEVITWTNRRSLAGISDIDMEGTINLGGTWTRNAISDAYESNGKGKLTGLTSINDTEVFIGSDGDALVVNIGAYLGPGAMGTISLGEGNYVDGSYAISLGYNVTTKGSYSISIGAASQATKDYSTALGGDAYADGVDSTAIGHMSRIEGKNSTALGANSTVAAEHTNSVAIGSESATSAADQVSFGHKAGDKQTTSGSATYDTDLFRSLTNISDIDMHGNISLGGEWTKNATSGVYESNGKGELTGVTKINGAVFRIANNETVLGANADAGERGVAFGYTAKTVGEYGVAIGAYSNSSKSFGVALGYVATINASGGTALGADALVAHENSVALGSHSVTNAANQVSFGHKTGDDDVDSGDVYETDLFRSLTNISDIDMHGNISLGGEWKENTTSGLYESNGKGELNGVTSINGVIFAKDSMNNQEGLLIGTLASGTSFYGDASVMIGLNIDNSAIDAVGIGNYAKVSGDGSVAIGYGAEAMSNMAMYPTAIGFFARAIGDDVVAIGAYSYAEHEYSVALGDDSSTSAENQVSFGHKAGDKFGDGGRDTYRDDLFRSLVNVADIDMHGALTGVTGIDGVTVSGTDASTGLTVGGNAVIGKTDTPFSSTGFAVAKDGAVTAKTVNGAAITSNSFNGVTLEKGADSHYKVGGVDVTKMQTDVAGKADAATTLTGYGITDAYTKTETDTAIGKKADKATTLTGYGIADAYTKTETDTAIGKKADKATTLTGYGIADAYTKTETDTAIGKKADKATTLTGYGIADAYTKTETDTAIGKKADKATTLTGYGIADAYTKTETDTAIGKKADKATTLTGYGITDAYTKTAADAKITAATADMATKTQVTADIGTAKTALESAYQAADTALGSRSAALETKTAKFNTAGDNLTGMANITSTAATLGGVGFASAGVMTGVASIDGIAIDASRNLSNAGTYNGVTVAAAGISGTSVFNGAAITNNSFNGVTLEKGADNHYKVGGVDVSALKTTVDSISADGVGTADTAGIKRDTTGTATTTIETNTAISSSGITTNKATVSGATATTLENGKLTVGAATVQNTGFAVGSSSLNNGSLTVDGNNKLTTAGLTASKVTVGTVTVSGGKVSGLTDAALSAVSTEAVTGKQLNATNTTVSALDTAYKAADTQIRTDFAAADTTLQNNIDAKVAQTAYDTKMSDLDSADTALGSRAAALETAVNDSTTGLAAVNTKVGALDTAYQAADTQIRTDFAAADTALSDRAVALETAATGMSYDAGKNTTTFTGGMTATVLTAGEFKVGATGFGFGSDGALTAKTVNGIEIQKDGAAVKVGGIDLTALSNGDVVTDNTKGIVRNQDTATTTIETNTAISSSGITTNAVTASGTVKAGEFVEGSQKLSDKYAAIGEAYTAEKAALKADKSDVDTLKTTIGDSTTGLAAVNTKVGALDTAYQAADTQIRTDFAAADNALKTELNTAIDEKAKKATDLAGYGITDAYTKNDADAKITAATADMATKTQLTADIGTAKTALENAYKAADTQIRTDFAAADTALSDRAAALETAATGMSYDAGKNTTTFTGGMTATVLTAGELKVGATGFGFGSDGALTAKTVNGIEIKKDGSAVKVGGIDLTALSKGDVVTDNTKGIDRNQDTATTTIETNTKISSSGITTNAVTASGTVKASEFVEGDKKLSDKYAAKTALDDYTTTTDMNTKLADYVTTTAVDTKLADYAKSDSVYSKAAADTAFAKADASNLPSDVSGWQSKLGISDISSKLAGFSYDNTSGTTTIGGMKLKGGALADVKSLNGKAVGADSKGITIDGIGLKDLSERVTAIENNGGGGTGGSTADTEGIKRTDVADGSGKTTVEGATGFTKDGLKTANLEAATAALGGVNFAAGAVTGVSSINGISFADGKLGGVSLSGGKVNGADITSTSFNGVDVKALKNKVDNLTPGSGGGTGGGDNTGGISKPDGDTTNIEGSTSITTDGVETNKVTATDSITVADATNNKTTISDKGIVVAEGKKNQVTISEDGIHVGKNSSVVNDTDGFITDKGLYIGVSSSSDTSTAKFSVAPNGNLSSKAGDYGFSNTSADGAKFTHSGDTAYGTGSQLDTTIQGNKVTTGRIDTDELYVDGNKVTVAGGTINQTDAVNNHLSGADADGNTVTNDFKTSAVNGTTQAAEKTSADGKESTKTVNNTSAGGTGVTTSKTTTDSKDNVTVKESNFGTNEKGMTLSTSNKVTDKDGKVTKDTSGTTTMTGDSISVSKTTTTTEKDADGNEKEVTKTSGTTIGSGEVTLKREDGSTIEVGSAIEGMQSDMRELDGRVNRMGVEIKEVGALSAALAGLHPQPENANSRADFAMAMGSYEGKQALAVGGFYRPDKRTMLSIGASTTSSKHMMNMGISIALDRLPEAERRAEEAAKAAGVEQETLNRVLERLAALEQDNRRLQADNEKRDVAYEKLAADYTQLKEKYIEETADSQQSEQAEAEE